jgi:hypothetical protein
MNLSFKVESKILVELNYFLIHVIMFQKAHIRKVFYNITIANILRRISEYLAEYLQGDQNRFLPHFSNTNNDENEGSCKKNEISFFQDQKACMLFFNFNSTDKPFSILRK